MANCEYFSYNIHCLKLSAEVGPTMKKALTRFDNNLKYEMIEITCLCCSN